MTVGWCFSPPLQAISSLLIPRSSVPVLEIPGSPYNEVVLPPSLDDFREFFHAVPQGEESATTIKISALSPSHHMLAKIIQQNMHVARRSDLILIRAQFVYVVYLRLPFCMCKHILGVMLEARDEGNIGLPFGCLLTQIIHPQWSGRTKPYKEITCNGRATIRTMCHLVRTKLLNRKDFPSKFFEKSCRTVVRLDGPCPSSGRRPGIFCLKLI
jgi:hypothetical protein